MREEFQCFFFIKGMFVLCFFFEKEFHFHKNQKSFLLFCNLRQFFQQHFFINKFFQQPSFFLFSCIKSDKWIFLVNEQNANLSDIARFQRNSTKKTLILNNLS